MTMEGLDKLYEFRFSDRERRRKDAIWEVLCRDFFQRFIEPTDTVLDIACGYGEFIRHIRAGRKLAIDLNEAVKDVLPPEVQFICTPADAMKGIETASVDVCFASNFFEHLPSKQALQHCMTEALRILRPGGRLLALGPNIRFCADVYWDFFDHHLPLSDRSLTEGLEITGFHTEKVIEKFLPFTMKGKLPPSPALVRAYLKLPWAWTLWGKQFFVVARKP